MTSEMTSRKKHRNSILMTCHFAGLGNASDWSCREGTLIQPIRSRLRSGQTNVINMEFLRSFLRRHFARKPAVASRNVGRFLSLTFPRNDHNLHYLYKKIMIKRQTDKFLHRHLVIIIVIVSCLQFIISFLSWLLHF